MLVDQKMEKEIVKNQSDFVIFTEGYTQIHLIKSEDVEEHDSVFWLYKIGVPMLMFLTILSFALNGFILLAILLRTNFLSARSSTRYLLLITSVSIFLPKITFLDYAVFNCVFCLCTNSYV